TFGSFCSADRRPSWPLARKTANKRSRSASVDHRLIVRSTWLVRADGARLLTSTANAVYFSGFAMFDCAAGTAMATTAASAAATTVRIETSNARGLQLTGHSDCRRNAHVPRAMSSGVYTHGLRHN